jgi:murein DD-endopeptidase MepM/ murein hydrolase activator NlpD
MTLPHGHNGIDCNAYDGEFVYAAHDGEVVFAGEDGSNGLLIVIRTLEQFEYGTGQAFYKTLYGHLQKGSIRVKAGDKVKAGQFIAQADNTGARPARICTSA